MFAERPNAIGDTDVTVAVTVGETEVFTTTSPIETPANTKLAEESTN